MSIFTRKTPSDVDCINTVVSIEWAILLWQIARRIIILPYIVSDFKEQNLLLVISYQNRGNLDLKTSTKLNFLVLISIKAVLTVFF
jgi:hypothetical protein